MIALILSSVLALASPEPSPACHGGDISVTDMRINVVKGSTRTATADRLLITGNFTNVGTASQEPHTLQHAELLRGGVVVGSQPLPALAQNVTYPLQFRIFRDTSERTDPIALTVRYVLDGPKRANRNNCTLTNDSMSKTF